jgi:truncated hemoglobin YjbI
MASIFEGIGAERLESILAVFYQRCFADVMIGHFFFDKDHDALLRQQLTFTSSMLGGPRAYEGRPLPQIHGILPIRPAHFARRQVILRETIMEHGLTPDIAQAWLQKEEKLRDLIMPNKDPCR